MSDLCLVTNFSFDSYVYFYLILVQIQVDSAYLLKTEIAETYSDWILDANLFRWKSLLFTQILCLSLMPYINLFHFIFFIQFIIWPLLFSVRS